MADKENLIDVGEENEEEVEIVLESEDENPNIADQFDATSETETKDKEVEAKKDERTPEQKLQEYLEADPELKEHYSRSVQKRIDKLTFERHEAERQRDAATDYAQGVQKENVGLKSKQQQQDGVFINEHKSRVEAQRDSAKNQYKEALANGDPDLIADANSLVAAAEAELAQAKQTETRFERFVKTTPQPEENFVPYSPQPEQSQQPAKPDTKAEAWAEKNTWFGEDSEMTNAALSIHQQMITQEGYLPTSDAYYEELSNRVQKNYPSFFNKQKPAETPEMQGQQVVTGGTNSVGTTKPKSKKNIHLSRSEVSIAKKLGVPLEEYAKYVVR